MAYVTAKALKDGPYEVSGGAKILDYTGKEPALSVPLRRVEEQALLRRQP